MKSPPNLAKSLFITVCLAIIATVATIQIGPEILKPEPNGFAVIVLLIIVLAFVFYFIYALIKAADIDSSMRSAFVKARTAALANANKRAVRR